MTFYLILIALTLIGFCVKKILDVNSLVLRVRKNTSLNSQKNLLEKNYQFIKGLY